MEFILGFCAGVIVTAIVAFLVWRNNKKHAEALDSKFDEKLEQVQGLINQVKK